MDGLINDHPSSFLIPGSLPVRTRIIVIRPIPGQCASGALHPPQPAVLNPLFHQLRRRIITALKNHAVLKAAVFRQPHRLLCVLILDAHGFLAEHVDARPECLLCHGRMQIMGQAQVHRVRLLLLQKPVVIRVCLRVIFVRSSLCPFLFDIAHRRKLKSIQMCDGIQMHHRNISAADHCSPEFFHNVPLLLFPPPSDGIS